MRKTLLLLLVLSTPLIVCSGCAKDIILHPVDENDIRMEKDAHAKDWICMSPEYIQEVMKARLGK